MALVASRYSELPPETSEHILAMIAFARVPKRDLRSVVGQLLDVLEDTTVAGSVRGSAAEALGQLLPRKQRALRRVVVARLIPRLRDDAPEVRFWTAFVLGTLRAKAARSELRRLVLDRTLVPGWWSVGDEAVDALSAMSGAEIPDRMRVSDASAM